MARYKFLPGNTINVGRIPWNKGKGIPDRKILYMRAYGLAHREELKAKNKAWLAKKKLDPEYEVRRKKKNCEYSRKAILRKKYGLSPEEYRIKLHSQNNLCALCHQPFDLSSVRGNFAPALDHCHKTGRVRDFLHNACNKGIGHFNEDPDILRLAAEYVERVNAGSR